MNQLAVFSDLNAVSTARPIDDSISNMELAGRIEMADEILQLRDEVEQQRGTIEHLQALTDRQAQRGAEEIEQRVAVVREQLVKSLQENQHLRDFNTELKNAGDELGKRLDELNSETGTLTARLTASERDQAQQQSQLTTALKQLKEYKQLNPDGLKRRLAELKKINQEKQTGIEALRKQNHKFAKDNIAKAETIRKLDIALDKACSHINEAATPAPLETVNLGALGKWELHGTSDLNLYDVLDVRNNVSMTLQVTGSEVTVPDLRVPPKTLLKKVAARAIKNRATEQKLAKDKQPLQEAG